MYVFFYWNPISVGIWPQPGTIQIDVVYQTTSNQGFVYYTNPCSNEDNTFTMLLFNLCFFFNNQSNYIYLYCSWLGSNSNWYWVSIKKNIHHRWITVKCFLFTTPSSGHANRNIFICTGCDKSFMITVIKHYLTCNLSYQKTLLKLTVIHLWCMFFFIAYTQIHI
jgi:hypothetical protein